MVVDRAARRAANRRRRGDPCPPHPDTLGGLARMDLDEWRAIVADQWRAASRPVAPPLGAWAIGTQLLSADLLIALRSRIQGPTRTEMGHSFATAGPSSPLAWPSGRGALSNRYGA